MSRVKTKKPARRTPETASEQLRAVIFDRGLTAYAVATAAGCAPSIMTRFLNRERGLSLTTFDATAQALGLVLVETRAGLRTAPGPGPRPTRGRRPEQEQGTADQ